MTERTRGGSLPPPPPPRATQGGRWRYTAHSDSETSLLRLAALLRAGATRIAFVGPPGSGKTLLLHVLSEQLGCGFTSFYLPNPAIGPDRIRPWIESCGELVPPDAGSSLVDLTFAYARRGPGLVLLVDDADDMPLAVADAYAATLERTDDKLRLVVAGADEARLDAVLARLRGSAARVHVGESSDLEEEAVADTGRPARAPSLARPRPVARPAAPVRPVAVLPAAGAAGERPGREAALDRMIALLRAGATRIALVGPPACGKTNLLHVLPQRLGPGFTSVHLPHPAIGPEHVRPWLASCEVPIPADAGGSLVDLALAAARRGPGLVLLIDDADDMPLPVAEAYRATLARTEDKLRLVVAGADEARLDAVLARLGGGAERVRLAAEPLVEPAVPPLAPPQPAPPPAPAVSVQRERPPIAKTVPEPAAARLPAPALHPPAPDPAPPEPAPATEAARLVRLPIALAAELVRLPIALAALLMRLPIVLAALLVRPALAIAAFLRSVATKLFAVLRPLPGRTLALLVRPPRALAAFLRSAAARLFAVLRPLPARTLALLVRPPIAIAAFVRTAATGLFAVLRPLPGRTAALLVRPPLALAAFLRSATRKLLAALRPLPARTAALLVRPPIAIAAFVRTAAAKLVAVLRPLPGWVLASVVRPPIAFAALLRTAAANVFAVLRPLPRKTLALLGRPPIAVAAVVRAAATKLTAVLRPLPRKTLALLERPPIAVAAVVRAAATKLTAVLRPLPGETAALLVALAAFGRTTATEAAARLARRAIALAALVRTAAASLLAVLRPLPRKTGALVARAPRRIATPIAAGYRARALAPPRRTRQRALPRRVATVAGLLLAGAAALPFASRFAIERPARESARSEAAAPAPAALLTVAPLSVARATKEASAPVGASAASTTPATAVAAAGTLAASGSAAPILVHMNARPWARIRVDGRELGLTPLGNVPLEPGLRRFRAEMADGTVIERVVQIDDANRRVTFP